MTHSHVYHERRSLLAAFLVSGQAIIIYGSSKVPKTHDSHYPFYQDPDFFYLTGLDCPDCVLWIGNIDNTIETLLIIPDIDPHTSLRTGDQLTLDQASHTSTIAHVLTQSDRTTIQGKQLQYIQHTYSNQPTQAYAQYQIATTSLEPYTTSQRIIKDRNEQELITQACQITTAGFLQMVQALQPGINEADLEAIRSAHIIKHHATYAFDPIIASGNNACTLHYHRNRDQCTDDTLVLVDIGARVGGYCADLSRTLPVSGRFTHQQASVYDACHRVYLYACTLIRPGMTFALLNQQVRDYMTLQLIDLGLIDPLADTAQKSLLTRQYFPHSIGHFVGLEVHDVGDKDTPFAPGMIITIEPGIYIAALSLGIRLENTILITDNGGISLFPDLPLARSEVEKMMRKI